MVGILVCTHSSLARGFKDAVEMVMGLQESFATIGFFEGEDMLSLNKKITNQINEMDTESNIIFTDLFGASPSNAAAMSLMEINGAVITGVNFPMLLESLVYRNQSSNLDELLTYIVENGKDSIKLITKEMVTNK